ncbi:MAG: DUF4920 domain-containing protein [Bacteroidota bacterium]
MKNLLFTLLGIIFLSACASKSAEPVAVGEQNESYFGEKITMEGAISLKDLISKVNDTGTYEGKVEGEITGTCAKKGCWMTLRNEAGDDIRVKFKDYGFFVPTEGQEGRMAIMQGIAWQDTVSVEMARHYAEDGGATPEEIAKITEPEYNVGFLADGVIIKQ